VRFSDGWTHPLHIVKIVDDNRELIV